MTISYKWISEYIPVFLEPEKLSQILTSIGLEVESMEQFEGVKGGLQGLVVGEVKECIKHPGADKLKLTKVDTGNGVLLQIVCGAPNVAVGQKVIVAPAGVTIHPLKGEPITMKVTKIRGEESFGMICAEDEVGLGESHDGILVLPPTAVTGALVSDLFGSYKDWIYEIGLTPNRMDAMSHLGVAKDVCAYLSHHEKKAINVKYPAVANENNEGKKGFEVIIENTNACKRYAGIGISGISVAPSPRWLQDKLKAIGQRPINNIVDITNFILHDTGQPLHAFDADKIPGRKIIVKNLPEGTLFQTLDEKQRKLSGEDLMICDGDGKGLCIAGVFGGIESGVTEKTKEIFLESAWFNPVDIRKTSFRLGLRTDAATRFEKNVDISQTLNVLKRAAAMMVEIAGGEINSAPVDVYPHPEKRKEVTLDFDFLTKLSGKKYDKGDAKNILLALGFEIIKEENNGVRLQVPYSKPDIELQADLVEEIMRIDGYDNIQIPSKITISPAAGAMNEEAMRREKTASMLVGAGFSEIFTSSITNAAFFEEEQGLVKLLNNLSAVHNVMRPSMLETGLESVAYNLNRKNSDLRFFEFGKTYIEKGVGNYQEDEHLCLYITGNISAAGWKGKAVPVDIFYAKGMAEKVMKICGLEEIGWENIGAKKLDHSLVLQDGDAILAEVGAVNAKERNRFDIRQEVFYVDIRWRALLRKLQKTEIRYTPIPNQLPVIRDLAMVLPAGLGYDQVERTIKNVRLSRLKKIQLFDVFESDKLGADKKSIAVTFTFLDEEKTLTDKEIDGMMLKIMRTLEQDLRAEIRKGAENTTR